MAEPREVREDLRELPVRGSPPEDLEDIIDQNDIDRVIVAFSKDGHGELLSVLHSMRDHGVQIDVVPRLFEVVDPRAQIPHRRGLARCSVCLRCGCRVRRACWSAAVDVVGASAPTRPHCAAHGAHRDPHQARFARPGLLPLDAARSGHARVHAPQVQDDARRDRSGGAPPTTSRATPASAPRTPKATAAEAPDAGLCVRYQREPDGRELKKSRIAATTSAICADESSGYIGNESVH
jgi:hypothetical protein